YFAGVATAVTGSRVRAQSLARFSASSGEPVHLLCLTAQAPAIRTLTAGGDESPSVVTSQLRFRSDCPGHRAGSAVARPGALGSFMFRYVGCVLVATILMIGSAYAQANRIAC